MSSSSKWSNGSSPAISEGGAIDSDDSERHCRPRTRGLAFTSPKLNEEKGRQSHTCRHSGREEAYSVRRGVDDEAEEGRAHHDAEIPCRRYRPHGKALFGLRCPVHDESEQGRIEHGCAARQEHCAREERDVSRRQGEQKEAECERGDGRHEHLGAAKTIRDRAQKRPAPNEPA